MDLSTIQGGKYPPILTYAEIEALNGTSIADATVAKLDALITPETESLTVHGVFTAADAKRDNRDVCVDKTLSPWYNEYIAVRRRSPCRRRAKLCPEPRTLRVGRPI